nr:MAG TPA: tail protein [Caudoviricetes sp.]
MTAKMKAAKIYSLSGNTTVDYELQAYAQGLDMVCGELETLQRESFVATASDYGLENAEKLLRIEAQENEEERRNAVMKRCAVTPNDFTVGDMERIFAMEGLDARICERFADQCIYVNCMDASTTEEKKEAVLQTAKNYLPAHLNAELDFRSISWNNIDGTDETFDTKDAFSYTWDAIDDFGGGVVKI